ncbi:MAG: DUF192 domain-containing protein [Patescibacteria group bacterium]
MNFANNKNSKRFIQLFIMFLPILLFAVLIYNFGFRNRAFEKVIINGTEFAVETADTFIKRANGLSGREELKPNQGMLFIFGRSGIHGFWMKDMKFSIDIIWIKSGKIIGFEKNMPPAKSNGELPVYYPPSEVDSVLEVIAGTVDKFKFMAGDGVEVL